MQTERKRKRAQENPEVRRREAERVRLRRAILKTRATDSRSERDFLARWHSHRVRDPLWFDNNLIRINNIRSADSRAKAIEVLEKQFPSTLSFGDFRVCSTYVQQKRCPCGQVLNMKDSSQLPGWEVRRDVSIQCGLQQMPLLPLPVKIVPSRSTGDNVEEGTHQGMSKASKDERLFQCHCCKYSAPEVYKLRRHLLTHSTVNPFECEVCPAAFRTLASYKAHICKHTGETLHECDLCPYSAAYKSRVLEHRRTHLNAYTMYAYRAKSKSRLRMQKHQHTSNKPFKCKVCSLGFTRKYSLKIHMQRHLESRLS
ncbi:zinc finger protein 490 isoform X2 [Rhipicephalus sanguineus]|uniref:zinc finger protein 490 isoform X2 n=1 Tax=Rhipicephalus sanguineus TaxID=34632 RepID=UPI001895CE1B|nr:zinc finger protein 490 isoform X2 [Rhipicephalus sanguineus]